MDNVPTRDDACPDTPEDLDGFQDDDGCPDPDNDQDTIPDVDDQCPDLPERVNNIDDEDGCPDEDPQGCMHNGTLWPHGSSVPVDACNTCSCRHGRLGPCTLLACRIEIREVIHFKRHQAAIPSASTPLLNEIAKALIAHPELSVVIQGHASADERRPDTLGERRAAAVLDHLIKRGVEARRLSARSFGAQRPIDREPLANRRVDFEVIQPESP